MNNVAYCPLRRDWCHPQCAFGSAIGCEVVQALRQVGIIAANISVMADDLAKLTSDILLVQELERETA